MTLLEALKQSRAMWLWLYENQGRSKIDYLERRYIVPLSVKNFCFICDYHIKGQFCQGDCPIKWVDDEETLIEPYACETRFSPYWRWINADTGGYTEHEAAGKIIDLHDEAIERCKKC